MKIDFDLKKQIPEKAVANCMPCGAVFGNTSINIRNGFAQCPRCKAMGTLLVKYVKAEK